MSRQRSLEQERAQAAWDRVIFVRDKDYAKEYGSLVRSAPADVQANGLGQTLAFWRAKGYKEGKPQDNAHARLYQDVSDWVRKQIQKTANVASSGDLLEWITKSATTDQYRHAMAEAIAFLIWLRRFAEAELPKGDRD